MSEARISRRGLLKALRNLSLFTAITTLPAYQYSFNIEPNWLLTKTVAVPIDDLPVSLEGFKIVQLSDIHLHPYTEIDTVIKAVERINALKPDLVAITGDFVYETAESIFELAPVLAEVKAKYGMYSILGNHDYWTLDDGWEGSPDLNAAMETSISESPTILLLHEPDFISETAKDHRITLQLSGHTHGGQVRIPGFGAPILPDYGRLYDYGLFRVNETWLYVNPGIGVIPPPVRFNCRPEITEFTLTRGG
jgi:predicted MPP superfamily phosphohydrolase